MPCIGVPALQIPLAGKQNPRAVSREGEAVVPAPTLHSVWHESKTYLSPELSDKTVACSEDLFLDYSMSLQSAYHLRYRDRPLRVV